MAEILETLSTYIARIERLEEQFASQDIIISDNQKREFLRDGDDDRIRKEPILWRLYQHSMFYVVTVPPGMTVKKHRHDEDIFRYVASGSLVLNGNINIRAGTWFVIRKGVEYEIFTIDGYVALSSYTSICQTNRGDLRMHLIEE